MESEKVRSRGRPWERGEGGSRGEEGGVMWREERGRKWKVWGAGAFQGPGDDECHRHYFEGRFLISVAKKIQGTSSENNSHGFSEFSVAKGQSWCT